MNSKKFAYNRGKVVLQAENTIKRKKKRLQSLIPPEEKPSTTESSSSTQKNEVDIEKLKLKVKKAKVNFANMSYDICSNQI